MFSQIVLWLFCVVRIVCTDIRVGHIKYDGSEDINWEPLTDRVDDLEISTETISISDEGSLATMQSYCQSTKDNGLAAVVTMENNDQSSTIESTSDFLAIPHINTAWASRNTKQFSAVVNLYPDAALLSQALAAVVESLDWPMFAILYEDEESLLKVQDIIKLQEHKVDVNKNTVIVKQLAERGSSSRHIFKQLRKTPVYSLVLDCSTDRIIDLLQEAKDVKLLDDLNTNIFLTSMDAHTLDYTVLNTKSNITTVRLFNPNEVLTFARNYFPEENPEQITVKSALMHDALYLLAESLNSLNSEKGDEPLTFDPTSCEAKEKYADDSGLLSTLQQTEIQGITGPILLQSGKRNTFDLNIIEMNKMDKPIALWSSDNPAKVVLTRNATEREAELQRRLQSHNFIVTSRTGSPYLFTSDDPDAVGNARYYGFSMDLIGEIAKIMNITFKFQITKDNAYGNLQKDLIERKADLAICDFTITPQRREVIDFSMPFMTLGIGILHKKVNQEQEVQLYGFLGPLSTVVWMYIGLLYIFMSFILVFIARLSTEDWENPHPCDQKPEELENIWDLKNCCWLTLGSITTQGCDLLPKGGCTRLATASWWFFSLIITSSYTANLAAFLTMSRKDDSIESVEELGTQSKVKYGAVFGGSTASFFQFSNNSLYQRMWNTMINEKPSVFEDSNSKGVERVQSTKNELYAFFMESTQIEYEMERKCDLRRIGDLLDSKSFGIGMPMNAEYRGAINDAVLRLQEIGKIAELKEKWWKQEREGKPCPSEAPVNTDALALENVGGVFIVLGTGIGLALLIGIMEFLWNVHNVSVEEHISFLDALKIEMKFASNIFTTQKRVKPLLSESSSSKSDKSDKASGKGILAGAGSFLNVNANILSRMGSGVDVDGKSFRSHTAQSKRSS